MRAFALLCTATLVTAQCDKKIGEEYPPADEDQWIKAITDGNIAAAHAQMPKEVVRGAHGKTHACARATWEVNANVPANLAHGVFTPGAKYDAWVRFSNGKGNSKEGDDRDVDVRGFAIKLIDVAGPRATRPAERNITMREDTTQDFIFISSAGNNAFITRIVEDYVKPGVGPPLNKICPACGANTLDLGAQYQVPQPLNISYGSLVNYVLDVPTGKVGMKYFIKPCDPSKTVPSTDATNGNSTVNRNFMRDALAEQLDPSKDQGVCMDFGVMMQTDACAQPMEDASVNWKAPWQSIAKLHFAPQHLVNSNQLAVCENLSFNPWHSLAVHRPAGGLSRSRLDIYFGSSGARYSLNQGGCGHVNPTSTCIKDMADNLEPAGTQCPYLKSRGL